MRVRGPCTYKVLPRHASVEVASVVRITEQQKAECAGQPRLPRALVFC